MSKEIWGGGSMPLGSRGDKSSTTFSSLSEFSAEEHLTRLFGKDHGPATKDQGPFRSLAGETNPEIFFQDLLQIAQKAEDKQDLQLASTVFAYVFQNAPQPSLRKQAEARLAGITGQGGTGAGRLEHLSRSWMDHAFDPAALAGMSAAGLAFQSGKLFTMARLWGKAAPQGIRIGGALGGFAVEVPAFVAVTKGASASMGREVDWSAQAWKTELISGAMVLGALKLSGFASGSGINKLHGVNPVTGQATRFAHWLPTTRTLGTQTGMLGGIMTGHSMEAAYFGHETPEGVNNLLDSFATLLQFNVAGKLTPMMAPRAHALSQNLGAESHRLSQTRPSSLPGEKVPSPWSLVSGPFSPAIASIGADITLSRPSPLLPTQLFMESDGEWSSGGGPRRLGQPDHIENARHAAKLIREAGQGKGSLEEAKAAVEKTLMTIRAEFKELDFNDPEFNLITKILFGKSLTPRALMYRFGNNRMQVSAIPYFSYGQIGFSIKLRQAGQDFSSFDVDLNLKKLNIHGQEKIGWVASRGRLYLPEKFKWQGNWTLLTFQLAEWARTGNFIAIEAESCTDGGKASMADIFDVPKPEILEKMKAEFNREIQVSEREDKEALIQRVGAANHPWEIMEITDQAGSRVGYDFLKRWSPNWTGVLPVQGFDSPQWMRLLRRAFMVKKLWKLWDPIPVPANTRAAQIESDQDLQVYFLDMASQRYLSSLQRMEDHIQEYAPPPNSTLSPIWERHQREKIQPLVQLLHSFRDFIRGMPQEVENGAIPPGEGLSKLEQAQGDLWDFKASIREGTAELNWDYLLRHRMQMLDTLYKEFHAYLPPIELEAFKDQSRAHWEEIQGFQEEKPTLSAKVQFLPTFEKKIFETVKIHAQRIAEVMLARHWDTEAPPPILVNRFSDLIWNALLVEFDPNSSLESTASDFAVAIAAVYRNSPWDFSQAHQLSRKDILLGVGTIRGHSETDRGPKSGELMARAVENFRALRPVFPEHRPLFLVKGSHFKAPIKTREGQDTDLLLVVGPSWGELEGGISFSIYHASQGPHLNKGKAKPLHQVVAHLNRSGEVRIRAPYRLKRPQFPQNASTLRNPAGALTYLALRWAGMHSFQPIRDYADTLNSDHVPEWLALVHALNHMSFTPAKKLDGLLRKSELEDSYNLMEVHNPFKISLEDDRSVH